MELLNVTLAANETRQFAKAGRYFEIIDSTYPVTIQFTGPGGGISDSMAGALSGLFIEDPFSHFSLTNGAAAQSVTLLLFEAGRGGSRRQPGNVRVIDEITPAIQYVIASQSGAIQAITWTPVVAPAANVKGLIVRGFSIYGAAGAGGSLNLLMAAAMTAPVGFATPVQKFVLGAKLTNLTSIDGFYQFQLNKLIPPGFGIFFGWEIATAIATVVPTYTLNYEPL